MTPAERHWSHVAALRQLVARMDPGEARDRVQQRYEAALAEHRARFNPKEEQ